MNNQYSKLAMLGWTDWFEKRIEPAPGEGSIARVMAVDREVLLVINQDGIFRAKLAGRYHYQHVLAQDFPSVGDWVRIEKQPTDDFGIIQALIERKTVLRRKSAGESVEYQMIAANLDWAIIVQSCHFDFNVNRLERYLVMVRDGGVEPCILLTKTDLITPETLADQLAEIEAVGITAPVMTLSNVTREGIDALYSALQPAKTYCFVGSSGVGKSTIINNLMGRAQLHTGDISGSGEGRHTTVRRELLILESGALVIDNPGMREFAVLGAENGIDTSFSDIIQRTSSCRYRNCSHTGEPGCAVIEALRSGDLNQERYDNYRKLKEESEYYQMSYAEKRKKDRDFGKFIKSVKKHSKG
ncbi:MAG: ribosome small subunit-dependent GTPase A [Desulforhopalus sp.]|nr:ribosome small subunit-dependent GTPase A [Desulforhopalus sp.]